MPQSIATVPQAEKLQALEGLRGVASLIVVLHHIRLALFYPQYLALHSALGPVGGNYLDGLLNGDFAVWLFWVMSALVLSIRFFRAADLASARASLADAALRRYPRLAIPVLASVLFAWALMACGLDHEHDLFAAFGVAGTATLRGETMVPSFVGAMRSALWDTFFSYEPSTSYNGVLWTMGKELLGSWFIFAWLALVGGLRWRWAGYAIAAVVLGSLSLQWLNAFVAGVVLCDLYAGGTSHLWSCSPALRVYRQVMSSRVVVTILLFGLWYCTGISNRGPYYVVLASAFVVMALTSPVVVNLLSRRPMVFLGKISFGLYLVHAPLLSSLAWPLVAWLRGVLTVESAKIITAMILIVASLFVGWLFWLLVDRHAVRLSREFAKKCGHESLR